MSEKYKFYDPDEMYFITPTIIGWVDVFTKSRYCELVLDSLRYCQKNKGLLVYAWVIMSNHVHMIISCENGRLSNLIRDLKKFTSTKIVRAIEENKHESRKRWLLWLLKKDDKIIFWEKGYHGEEITSISFFESKLNYIHQNPVRVRIVEKEEEYLYSSCGDYYGIRKGLIELATA